MGGLLTALGSPALGPFTFLFSFLFGALTDGSLWVFRINASSEGVNRNRLIIAMAVATMLIGLVSYSAFAIFPQFVPLARSFKRRFIHPKKQMLDMLVLLMGPATGVVAGYAAAYLWNRYFAPHPRLKALFPDFFINQLCNHQIGDKHAFNAQNLGQLRWFLILRYQK